MTSLHGTLYTRPGCHLCEDAEADLQRLRVRLPHTLTLVDITAVAALEQRYGERIPVLVVGGREYAAPLTRAVLEQALREGAASMTQLDPSGLNPS
jgi:hypothetical protein